jgi:hypothetical protein
MGIPLKATHLNLRAIINKVHQWHRHQYINSKLHEEEEEEGASLKAVWLLFAAAVYWTTAAATQQSSLIELSLNTGLPKTFWLLSSMDSGSWDSFAGSLFCCDFIVICSPHLEYF